MLINHANSLQADGLCPKFVFQGDQRSDRKWFPGTTTPLSSILSASTPGLMLIVTITALASELPFFFVNVKGY